MTDEILRKYGDAFNVGYDLTNMSNMLLTQSINAHRRESHLSSLGNNGNNELVLASTADYQSSQALSREAISIFEDKLLPVSQDKNNESNNDMVSVFKVKDSLAELDKLLNNKTSPIDLMNIVHTQIHPGLQLTYGLELDK